MQLNVILLCLLLSFVCNRCEPWSFSILLENSEIGCQKLLEHCFFLSNKSFKSTKILSNLSFLPYTSALPPVYPLQTNKSIADFQHDFDFELLIIIRLETQDAPPHPLHNFCWSVLSHQWAYCRGVCEFVCIPFNIVWTCCCSPSFSALQLKEHSRSHDFLK